MAHGMQQSRTRPVKQIGHAAVRFADAFAVVASVTTLWSSAKVAIDQLPKNAVITPKGKFTEHYRTPFHAQAVPVEVKFENEGATARATFGSGGNGGPGGMESWVALKGNKPQLLTANWSIGDTLKKGIDITIRCGARPAALRVVKTLQGLSGTPRSPEEKHKLVETITPLASDQMCLVELNTELNNAAVRARR